MTLAIKYENVADAQMRLKGTVVLYKGAPVQIQEVMIGTKEEPFKVFMRELPITYSGKFGRIIDDDEPKASSRKFISSKYFDIAPFKMGYVNRPAGNGAFYTARLPGRVQKQGLCAEIFAASDNFGNGVDFLSFLKCPQTPAMVVGDYPSFDVAITALKKCKAVAFHRDFCLVKDEVLSDLTFLYHKGVRVGMVKERRVVLGDKFKCLKESLTEMTLKVEEA